jgi:hypothetical protein
VITHAFTGRLDARKRGDDSSHMFATNASGEIKVSIAWTGGGQVVFTVRTKAGEIVLSDDDESDIFAATVPAGVYVVDVRTTSGAASYTLLVTHY